MRWSVNPHSFLKRSTCRYTRKHERAYSLSYYPPPPLPCANTATDCCFS